MSASLVLASGIKRGNAEDFHVWLATTMEIIIPAEQQGALAKEKKANKKDDVNLTVASVKKEGRDWSLSVAESTRIEE